MIELTILMPCLNEAETLASCIEKARQFLARERIQGEVLIADNGSTDGSDALAVQHGARVVYAAQKGYGAALMTGIREAKGKYVIMGDADDSYDFSNLMPFIQQLRQGHELVMGNRFQGGIKPGAMPYLNKYLGNPVLSFLGRLFYKCPIGDFHCGLRGFERQAMISLDLQTTGMEFASEMVVKAALNRLKITEVPTVLSPDGRSRPPHLRKWRDGWRHLRFLLLSSPRWMFLYPGAVLMFLGVLIMSLLSFSSLKIGHYSFDIHTLLFASAFVVLGLQCIHFSIFSKILANMSMNLPLGKKLESLIERYTLEKGIVIGLLCIGMGLIGAVLSFLIWMKNQFGILVPSEMMRLTIPSVTFLICGAQIIFASFFMNLLLNCQQKYNKNE